MRRHGAEMLVKSRFIWRNWRRKKRKMKRRRRRKKHWDKHFSIQACWYIQTCLTHNRDFTQSITELLYRTSTFSHNHFSAQKLLHTQTRLHTHTRFTKNAFTQRPFYTQTLFIHKHVYTQTLLHTTHKHFYTQPFYTETHLHTNTFTHRRFYTETHSHRDAEKYRITGVLYAKEKNMLQMISRKKIEMTCEDSKLKSDEVHRKSFIRRHFDTHTLLLYAHTLLYTNAFADGHTHTDANLYDRHTHTWWDECTHTDRRVQNTCAHTHTHTLFFTQRCIYT